jgi:hypothetical protein
MAFFDNLSIFKKREILTSSQFSLSMELSSMLLRNNVDPSNFDENSFDLADYPNMQGDGIRISQICDSLKLIQMKLQELS